MGRARIRDGNDEPATAQTRGQRATVAWVWSVPSLPEPDRRGLAIGTRRPNHGLFPRGLDLLFLSSLAAWSPSPLRHLPNKTSSIHFKPFLCAFCSCSQSALARTDT